MKTRSTMGRGAVLAAALLAALAALSCSSAPSGAARPQVQGGLPPMAEMAPPPPSPMPSASKSMQAPPGAVAGARGAAAPAELDVLPGASPAQDASAEDYRKIVENPFKQAADDHFSTFAVDVDTASYANVRRFLKEGALPPVDAVRIEELVNYFEYGWREPAGGAPIAVSTESAAAPWAPGHRLVAIGLRTRSVSAANLPPSNLVFLVDSSGSMSDPGKLPIVKRGFALLAESLRSQDRVAIVSYAGSAGLVLPSTPGSEKARILEALERLEAGGSTAGGAGIALAYETARANFRQGGNNRVILATDGDFNVGPSSDAALDRLIVSWRDKGVFLSVIGVGTGNLKDSRMKSVADKGNGNYNYADSVAEARRILVEQMGATLLTVAKDVKVQVEFDKAAVKSWRLIGYESRLLSREDFADDKKDAGEMGAGHRVTALYEVETASPDPAASLGILRLRWKKPDGEQSSLLELPLPDGAGLATAASADWRFAASVAAYGLLLRDSAFKGSADWQMVLGLAGRAIADGGDPSGRRAEFLSLAECASRLKRK